MAIKFRYPALTLVIVSSLLCSSAFAFEQGRWLIRAGATNVDPKSNNHSVVKVDASAALSLNATYMISRNWALDILAAVPFKHNILLLDGTKIADTNQLPPTISLQYHFRSDERFQPYLGFGFNYTLFFNTDTTGPLADSSLDLGDSIGLATQLGFDYAIDDHWFLNFDIRYMDIHTVAKLDGASLGTVKIDPLVYGVSLGYQF